MTGKILFYDEHNGNGIIMTQEHTKLNFNIMDWDDFENMPTLGLEVSFSLKENKPVNIVTSDGTYTEQHTDISQPNISQQKIQPQHHKANLQNRYKNQKLTHAQNQITTLLDNTQENISSMHQKIQISVNIADSMQRYFQTIDNELAKREIYKKVDNKLSYKLAKRFLWTTFNNLIEIDHHIFTPKIKALSNDLKHMGEIYTDFTKKIQYPSVAFEDVFLSCQKEYKKIKETNEKIFTKLSSLQAQEKTIDFQRQNQKKKIVLLTNKQEIEEQTQQLKILNGTYVDIVHMIAELNEQYKQNLEMLHTFENTYKEEFYKKFNLRAQTYTKNILNILDAQAYLLDSNLWKEAKVSHAINLYFKESAITGDLNTKTYLKYYLSSLDETKMNASTKELYKLYEHLKELHKEHILFIGASYDDILDYEPAIKMYASSLSVKSFTNELTSIKWAITNCVKILVLQSNLETLNAKKYLDIYHSNLFSKPKLILIGSPQHSINEHYNFHAILPENVSQKKLSQTIQALVHTLEEEDII